MVVLCSVFSLMLGAAIPPLTDLSEAYKVPRSYHLDKVAFRATGHIISKSPDPVCCNFWHAPNRLPITGAPDLLTYKPDDLIEITGHYDLWRGNRRYVADSVRVLQRGVLPTPVIVDTLRSVSELLYSYVRVRGVLVKARADALDKRFTYLVLRDATGVLTVGVPNDIWPGNALLDAEVEAEGQVSESTGWRHGLPPMLTVNTCKPLTVIRPAPSDITEIPPLKEGKSPHRQRADGTVIATSGDRFYLKHPSNDFAMEIRPHVGEPIPPVGTHVTVAGFARLSVFRSLLDEALVRISPPSVGGKPLSPPENATDFYPGELVTRTNGSESVNTRLHGHLVRCRGIVRRLDGDAPSGRFHLLSDGHLVSVDMQGLAANRHTFPDDGAKIEATGLLLLEFENIDDYASLPVFRRFTLIPRYSAEIRTIERAPWWTTTRLLVIISVLALVLIVFAIWNRLLQALVERRGKELFRARFAHAKADLKVEERTHLAVELHDSLSQTLTGVAMQIETAASLTEGSSNPIRKILATAGQMLASCRGELQSCIWDLRSRTFDEKDMTEAVTRTVDTHIGTARLAVRFNVPRSQLSETTTHAILRIVRELAVNAVRHGAATEIRIAGNLDDGVIRFSVTDNGRGFEPDEAPGPRDGHFGLQGVRERLNEFAGTLEIESQIGKGTRIKVTMKPRDDQ